MYNIQHRDNNWQGHLIPEEFRAIWILVGMIDKHYRITEGMETWVCQVLSITSNGLFIVISSIITRNVPKTSPRVSAWTTAKMTRMGLIHLDFLLQELQWSFNNMANFINPSERTSGPKMHGSGWIKYNSGWCLNAGKERSRNLRLQFKQGSLRENIWHMFDYWRSAHLSLSVEKNISACLFSVLWMEKQLF